MDALDEYVRHVRDMRERSGMPDTVPDFSPQSARTEARVLVLLQDPGRSGAAVTGKVDRDNPDPTARVMRETESVLPGDMTVSWNAIPWAQERTVAKELELVRRWDLVPKLLDALPRGRVVILCGGVAHRLTLDLYEYAHRCRPELLVLHGPHPSRRGLGDRWFGRGARKRWLMSVLRMAHDYAVLDDR